jgi:ABC-type amino acid transport substrate-binding protein
VATQIVKSALLLLASFFTATTPVIAQTGQAEVTLDRIKTTQTIRIGYREGSVPFSYEVSPGKPAGYTIELCERLVSSLRTALKLQKLDTQFVKLSASQRLPAMTNREVDLECGNTTNTPERRKSVAFSVPMFIAGIRIMSPTTKRVGDLTDLYGKRVVSLAATTSTTLVENQNKRYNAQIVFVPAKDHAESMKILAEGKADAWMTDDVILYANRAAQKAPQDWAVSRTVLTVEPLAVMFRKDEPEFAGLINREMKRIMTSGDIFPIYKKWFETPLPDKNINMAMPMSALMRTFVSFPTEELPPNF